MSTQRISVRIPATLGQRLRQQSENEGDSESKIVRLALEKFLAPEKKAKSAYDLAREAGLVGPGKRRSKIRLPRDLSTNPRYFEGFGE